MPPKIPPKKKKQKQQKPKQQKKNEEPPPRYTVLKSVPGPSSGQDHMIPGPSWAAHTESGPVVWRPLFEPRPAPRPYRPPVVLVPSRVRQRVPGQHIRPPYPVMPYRLPGPGATDWVFATPTPEERMRVQLNTNLYFRDNRYTVTTFHQREVVADSPPVESMSSGCLLAQALLLEALIDQCRSLYDIATAQPFSYYQGFPILEVERVRMISRMYLLFI